MSTPNLALHPHTTQGSDTEVSQPVVVKPCIYMFTVKRFDDATGVATVSYRVGYRWTDPRLAGWPVGKDFPPNLWTPDLSTFGTPSDSVKEMLLQKEHTEFGSIAFDGGEAGRAEGKLFLVFHAVTEDLDCRASSNIEAFPLDSHHLLVGVSVGKTIEGCSEKVVWDPGCADGLFGGVSGEMDAIEVQQEDDEWEIYRVVWGFMEHGSKASGLSYHDAMIRFERRRLPGWYIRKAVWPTVLCAFLSISALIVPAIDVASRFSILLTLFLTCFAIQWVSTDRLPKTPKLTRLDKIVELCVCFIVAIAVWSMGLAAALQHGEFFSSTSLDEDSASVSTLRKVERAAFVIFSAAWLIGAIALYNTIYKHTSQQPAPTSADWFGYSYMTSWEGCVFESNVNPESGKMDTPQAVPATGKPPSVKVVANPIGID